MSYRHRYFLARPKSVCAGDYIRLDAEICAAQVRYDAKKKVYEFCRTPSIGPGRVAPYLEVWEQIPDPVELELDFWMPD